MNYNSNQKRGDHIRQTAPEKYGEPGCSDGAEDRPGSGGISRDFSDFSQFLFDLFD